MQQGACYHRAPFDEPLPKRRAQPLPPAAPAGLVPGRRIDAAPPMIHRLLARLIPGSDRPRKARVYGAADQPLRRSQLSRGALEVT